MGKLAWFTPLRSALAAGAVGAVIATGGVVVTQTDLVSSSSSESSGGGTKCTVPSGGVAEGHYRGTSPIERQTNSTSSGGPAGTLIDRSDETGSLTLSFSVSDSGEISGTWDLLSNVTGDRTHVNSGTVFPIEPFEVRIANGIIKGTGRTLELSGGDGTIGKGGMVKEGTVTYNSGVFAPYQTKGTVNLTTVTCDDVGGTTSYPPAAWAAADFTAPPDFPAVTIKDMPQQWKGKRAPKDCKEKPKFSHPDPTPERVVASTLQEFMQKASHGGDELGHMQPNFSFNFVPDADGKIDKANIELTTAITRPVQVDGHPAPTPDEKKLMTDLVEQIRAHEEHHRADYEEFAQKIVCAVVGETMTKGQQIFDKMMKCEADQVGWSLDKVEGDTIIVRDKDNKAIGTKGGPRDPKLAPKIPKGC